MHGGRDVLHFLRADVGELHRQLVGDLLVHGARHADAADFGEALEPRGDIDAITKQIAVALDHITDGDADPERHLPARRIGHVARAQAFLDVDRATHGLDRAGKFREHRIARGVENAAAALCNEIVGDLTIGGEPPQRLFLILGDQSTIACNIGREDRCDLALHEDQPRNPNMPGRMPPDSSGRNKHSTPAGVRRALNASSLRRR
ncbi:hypothetical protein ACVIGA_004609 [Bradyrhizobium sp. USDA 3240]